MKFRAFAFAMILALLFPALTFAAQTELRISKQYGINYLPLIVLEEQKLIEKKAAAAGLGEVKVNWATLGGGSAANDALLSGSVDIIALGVPPFIRLWDKTKGKVKGLAPFSDFAPTLTSNNPDVKSIKDLTEKDRIALPAVKVSLQALLLQIAAAKEYGLENHGKYDHLTVTLSHPDGLLALTSGSSGITAHFTQDPFLYTELKLPNIHAILSGSDVLGGPGTFQLVAASQDLIDKSPKLAQIFVESLGEAINWINANKADAAKLYVRATKSKESDKEILDMLNDPKGGFSLTPKKSTVFSDFLFKTKAIQTNPGSWKDLYFPYVHNLKGS
jgi:NitT/TauT family transport system substrate-binding protein